MWTEEESSLKASLGKGPLTREVVLGLLPLAISLVVLVSLFVGASDLTSLVLLDVGNRSLTQAKLVSTN